VAKNGRREREDLMFIILEWVQRKVIDMMILEN
jgi:hypothetical protein